MMGDGKATLFLASALLGDERRGMDVGRGPAVHKLEATR